MRLLPKSRAGWRRMTLLLLLTLLLANVPAVLLSRMMTHFRAAEGAWGLAAIGLPRPENRLTPESIGLGYSVHRIELGPADWVEGWYLPQPQAAPVVAMFHAHGGSKESLLGEARALHRLGYALFLVDFRGGGGSSGSITTLGLREGNDVAAAFAYVQATWPDRPIVLYGASMGAASVMRALATSAIRPAAIMLEQPFDRLVTTVGHRAAAWGLPAWPTAEFLLLWGAVQLGVDAFGHNPVDYAAAVHCPVLLLHGERDPWISRANLEAILARLDGPSEVSIFPGAGHGSLLVRDRERWTAAVSTFLTRVAPVGR